MAENRRVILKVSGEQLGSPDNTFDMALALRVVSIIRSMRGANWEVACVMGGGNVVRGQSLAANGFDNEVLADEIGMLATVQNGAFLEQALDQSGVPARLMSNVRVPHIAEDFSSKKARHEMTDGKVVLVGGGTGKTGFTTDSGVVVAAHELGAPRVVKTTKVDGVYTSDPEVDPQAKKIDNLTIQEAIKNEYGIMDHAAFGYAKTHGIGINVCKPEPEHVLSVLSGETTHGTIISSN